MKTADPKIYHQLFGVNRKRTVYFKEDFFDYAVMLLITGTVIVFSYGANHILTGIGLALCFSLLVAFPLRHGVAFKTPLILRKPQDLIYMFLYKIKNIRAVYLFAISVLAAENIFIYFTPSLPHHTDLMRTVALYLFFIHLVAITSYRTVSLYSHIKNRELAREILMQTPWRKAINAKTNMYLEIFHAYFTGLLTHIVLIAPWFFVINHLRFSIVLLPLVLVLNFFTHWAWMKIFNDWLYRDHWLGHNSEFEFIYLHGAHHDVIPSGMIAVSGNGILEGYLRHTLGAPVPFYNPIFSFLMYSLDIKGDIDLHQFIPGIFPKINMDFFKVHQHSMHHYGRLEPYGFGLKFDQPGVSEDLKKKFKLLPKETWNTVSIDEELNGFQWNNPLFLNILNLFEKYRESEVPENGTE